MASNIKSSISKMRNKDDPYQKRVNQELQHTVQAPEG